MRPSPLLQSKNALTKDATHPTAAFMKPRKSKKVREEPGYRLCVMCLCDFTLLAPPFFPRKRAPHALVSDVGASAGDGSGSERAAAAPTQSSKARLQVRLTSAVVRYSRERPT